LQSEHKIQSGKGSLLIEMDQVPKILKPMVDEWTPDGFVVSFKVQYIGASSFFDRIHDSISLKQILPYWFRNPAPRWNVMDITSLLETTFIVVSTRWCLFRANIKAQRET